jgi:hypothetical protein
MTPENMLKSGANSRTEAGGLPWTSSIRTCRRRPRGSNDRQRATTNIYLKVVSDSPDNSTTKGGDMSRQTLWVMPLVAVGLLAAACASGASVAIADTTARFSEGEPTQDRGTWVMVRNNGAWRVAALRVLPAERQ